MYLNAEKVNRALDCSDKVLRALGLDDPASAFIPASIEEIQDYVVATTGWSVTKEEVIYPQGQYIRGRLHRLTGKRALIHIRRDQEPDWKRLVAAKELFELLVAGEEDMCPYGDEILETLVLEGHIGIISVENPNGGNGHQTELISELAAMETLYPLGHRLKDIEKLHPKGALTIGKLSLQYGIPEGTAATMVSSRYRKTLEKARRLISA
jgi:hypothetical protein